jgi:hypothetical protein
MKIVDYKQVDMTNEEYEEYKKLVNAFTYGTYSGKDQFRDLFEVDGDGCIILIKTPAGRQIGWGIIFFLQNLMINQRLRRMEEKLEEMLNGRREKSDA